MAADRHPPSPAQESAVTDTPPEVGTRSAIQSTRLYWDNLKHIGEAGGPPLDLSDPRIPANAEMARTAALVAIAESLERLSDPPTVRQQARRLTQIAGALESLAKKLDKIEYHMR